MRISVVMTVAAAICLAAAIAVIGIAFHVPPIVLHAALAVKLSKWAIPAVFLGLVATGQAVRSLWKR